MRRAEPRIVDPATHPRRYVSPRVAAIWLEVDEKTLRKYLSAGLIPYMQVMSRRRIEVSALVEFEKRNMIRSTVGARR